MVRQTLIYLPKKNHSNTNIGSAGYGVIKIFTRIQLLLRIVDVHSALGEFCTLIYVSFEASYPLLNFPAVMRGCELCGAHFMVRIQVRVLRDTVGSEVLDSFCRNAPSTPANLSPTVAPKFLVPFAPENLSCLAGIL